MSLAHSAQSFIPESALDDCWLYTLHLAALASAPARPGAVPALQRAVVELQCAIVELQQVRHVEGDGDRELERQHDEGERAERWAAARLHRRVDWRVTRLRYTATNSNNTSSTCLGVSHRDVSDGWKRPATVVMKLLFRKHAHYTCTKACKNIFMYLVNDTKRTIKN